MGEGGNRERDGRESYKKQREGGNPSWLKNLDSSDTQQAVMDTQSQVEAALECFNQQRVDETWQQKLLALEYFNQQTVSGLAQASPRRHLVQIGRIADTNGS